MSERRVWLPLVSGLAQALAHLASFFLPFKDRSGKISGEEYVVPTVCQSEQDSAMQVGWGLGRMVFQFHLQWAPLFFLMVHLHL